MTALLVYLMKASIGLCVVYVFYQMALSKITFYQWNRVYLLSCSLMAFLLPLININALLRGHDLPVATLGAIPSLRHYVVIPDHSAPVWTIVEWAALIAGMGMLFRCAWVIMNYASLKKVRKGGKLWYASGPVQVFSTEAHIAPFSFARSIYINPELHSDTELQQILAHEMVHVHQKHTVDLLLSEIVCVVNWFNPFAWWIRRAIRQNLEFVADQQVLTKGFDSRQYQYLLLKVVATGQAAIGHPFNIYNLKKRIQMMNRVKSSRHQLCRFLFAGPLLLVVLMAFRKDISRVAAQRPSPSLTLINATDTVPPSKRTSFDVVVQYTPSGPYQLSLADDNGESIVVIRNKENRIVKALTIGDWNRDKVQNEKQYGSLPKDMPARKQTQPTITTSDGTSLAADTITISGIRKLTIQSPLYVVDGVEQRPGFEADDIDPKDILQVSVFKGQHAIARYGEKGGAGVVEISTRRLQLIKTDTLKLVR